MTESDLAAAVIIKVERHIKDFRDGKVTHQVCAACIAASGVAYLDTMDKASPNTIEQRLAEGSAVMRDW